MSSIARFSVGVALFRNFLSIKYPEPLEILPNDPGIGCEREWVHGHWDKKNRMPYSNNTVGIMKMFRIQAQI